MMSILTQLVVFRLGDQRYAVLLHRVERVIPAVEITVLPNAPAIVLGVINRASEIIPVLNLRRRFGLVERDVVPSDQFLIVQTGMRTVALVVDEVMGVIEQPNHEIVVTEQIVPNTDQVEGLIKQPDGLVLLHDLEKILSWEEMQGLERAVKREGAHAR